MAAGVRPSARVELTADELAVAARDASGVGLAVVPLSWGGGRHRCAVTRPELARVWHVAHAAQDDEVIGQLLGFPACCRAKFREVWVERQAADQAPYCDAFAGPWETNVLWRTQGVRLVPHLPCSGNCTATLGLARALLAVGRENDVDVESIEHETIG